MYILGISAYYHDSAACLVKDGRIVAAAQEERFTRKKHDWEFPSQAVNYCLGEAKISIEDIDEVIFYDKPFLKFERILETHLAFAPRGLRVFLKAIPIWMKQKIWVSEIIKKELGFQKNILFAEHHQSHAASAFYPSPFNEAAILTVDGVGEWATTSIAVGEANKLNMVSEIKFPHSLGLLYSAFTYYAGFKVNSGEYKLMGLAPYGKPVYKDLIMQKLIDLKEDGSFRLNMKYFSYCAGLRMTNRHFHNLFGGPPRKPESRITQKDMDIAASIQEALEEILLRIIRYVHQLTGKDYLCLAGGVALNCVANGKLLKRGPFKNIWIQPAAGDAGGALGAAMFAWYQHLNHERVVDERKDFQEGSYLGPGYDNAVIENELSQLNAKCERLDDHELAEKVAELIAQEKVVGWFQGRMEFGPRALGSRSILGDARSSRLQSTMNLKIKFRESFRPFAPTIKADRVSDYFELEGESPYMMLVAPVREDRRKKMTEDENQLFGIDKLNVTRSDIPAVTHVDYSARIQTVNEEQNPLFYKLLSCLENKHNSPVVINTSFNVRGEPIVLTPEDAYRCFMRTDMDYLVVGNYLLDKSLQSEEVVQQFKDDMSWKKEYALD